MPGKSRTHRHHAPRPATDAVSRNMPTREDITAVFNVDVHYAAYANALTSDTMLTYLNALPADVRKFAMRNIGLTAARQVTRAAATQIVTRLAAGGARPRREELIATLFSRTVFPFGADLTAAQWGTIFGDDDLAAAQLIYDESAAYQAAHVGEHLGEMPATDRIGLVAAVGSGLPGAAIALGILARTDSGAADAYAKLRTTFPDLPKSVDPARATPQGRVEALGGTWPTGGTTRQAVEAVAAVLAAASPDDKLADRIEVLTATGFTDEQAVEDSLQHVVDGWGDITYALAMADRLMRDGKLPEESELRRISAFVRLGRALAQALDVADRDGLEQALEALRSRDDVDPARAWLLRLAAMVGPADLTDEIEQVAELARTAANADAHELDGALAALLTLIDLGSLVASGEDADFDAMFDAQATARQGLPQYGRLIYQASTGTVVVPPAEDLTDDDTEPGSPTREAALAAQVTDETPDAGGPAAAATDEVGDEVREPDQDRTHGEHDSEAAGAADSASVSGLAVELTSTAQAAPVTPQATEELAADDVTADPRAQQSSAATGGASDAEPTAHDVPTTGAAHQDTPADASASAAVANDDEVEDDDELEALRAAAGGALRRHTSPDSAPEPDDVTPLEAVDAAPQPQAAVSDINEPAGLTWGDQPTTTLDRELINAGRYAMAAEVAALTGANDASVAARQLAAYAQHVRTATGEMAAAFSERAAAVVREDLGDDRIGQLAAWAAAAKMAVLAPPAGPADTLINLTPCIEQSPALLEVTDAFVEAARNGVSVVAPDAIKTTGALAAAQAAVRELSAEAETLLSTARHRTMKYIPANEVYTRWISATGALGPSLAAVRDNDTSKTDEVKRHVVEHLRGKGERNMEAVFRTFANRSTKTITAGPRQQLLDRWEEAVSLCSRWVAACEEVTAQENQVRTGTWQDSALARLRAAISDHRDAALADLTAWENAEGIDSDDAPSSLLETAFDACDGGAPAGEEPTRAYVEHGELLALAITLHRQSLAAQDPQHHQDAIMALAAEPELTGEEVYDLLAQRAAHDLSEILVANTRALDAAAGARLDTRRNRDMSVVDAQVRDEVAELRAHIDMRRLSGTLSDTVWSSVSARTEQLATPGRRDYEAIRAHIADINAALDAEHDARVAETRERIEAAVLEHDTVAEHQQHLLALCAAGQLSTAEEQLQQAIEGEGVTQQEAGPEHLSTFFPAVPDVLARHKDVLRHVSMHLREQVETPVTNDLAQVGVDLFALSPARIEQAKHAISSWGLLTSSSPVMNSPVTDKDSLAQVLRQAGLEFTSLAVDKGAPRPRQWMTLSGVRGVGKAPTPVLGSGMSPGETDSLRVLLVRQATTPSTVIEWMSGEPGDRTVLVLWLHPTALTAGEWRAVGEASRGRKNPPVVMLDLGALLYLCAQAEPRRTTLASIALPFTSANPYRDTHGDAAPEMFFGRTEERAEIVSMHGSSFVSGGRQLGKTTLLRHAARHFSQLSEHHVAVFKSIYHVGKVGAGMDGPPERVWNHLWPELVAHDIVPSQAPTHELADVTIRHIRDWLAGDERRQLLILLDEADDFLDADAEHARFVNVGRFRDLMADSGRRVKVVLAGLHRTARFESLPNQPLSHLGRPIVVGPLRPQHAYEMLTVPMAAMGYKFDDQLTAARALATANNMPAQLQLMGASLVEHMSRKPIGPDGPPMTITVEDVEDAYDHNLQVLFREKFTLTLTLDPRYKVIAYVVAQAAHESGIDTSLTLSELSDECRGAWPEGFANVSTDMFRGLVEECIALGVLAKDGTRYRLRTPTVLRLLGTDVEVFDELANASETLVVPTVSDGGAYRERIGRQGEETSSALTARQVAALLKPEPAVTVITGSNATGLSRVLASIEHAAASVHGLNLHRCGSKELLVTSAIGKAAGRTWLLIDARTATVSELIRTLQAAQDATDRTRQPVRTIVVASHGSAPAWVRWTDRMDLARYEPQGLAMHADLNNLPFAGAAQVARLQEVTGGWPELVDKVTAAAHAPDARLDANGLLEVISHDLEQNPGALAAAVGVAAHVDAALHTALITTIGFTEHHGEELDLLGELLDEADEVRTELARAGFANGRDAIQALVALGAVVTDSDGRMSVEPVLRADLTAAAR